MAALRLQPFSKLLEKAGNLLGISTPSRPPPLDGEIVFSKNNVCVHQGGSSEDGAIPGYLTLRCQADEKYGSTLILNWVPNATIKRNPAHSENSPISVSPKHLAGILRSGNPSQVYASTSSSSQSGSSVSSLSLTSSHSKASNGNSSDVKQPVVDLVMSGDYLIVSTEVADNGVPLPSTDSVFSTTRVNEMNPTLDIQSNMPHNVSKSHSPNSVVTVTRPDSLPMPAIEESSGDTDSDSSGTTEGPDSRSSTPELIQETDSPNGLLTATAERFAESHHLTFPDYVTMQVERKSQHTASVFSVDLGSMRSLRLFYSNDESTCGQLVLASRESQYKIFHFYNGGLDKLADILEEWNLFHSGIQKKISRTQYSQQFRVVRPKVPEETECHPEERLYEMVTPALWMSFMNPQGQICDFLTLRKAIFFSGLDPSLRLKVWPFLLFYYPCDSTYEQREQIRHDKYIEYQKLRKKREELCKDETWMSNFWRSVQNTVEKDVVRTDRGHPYFHGDGNPNVEILKEILLNYAVAHPHLGYTQGMSDLLSPVLSEMNNEADAYWCFVGLMQRTIFVSSPKDHDMDRQLLYLKEMLRLMHPKFFQHLMSVGEAVGMLFVHRWILLCFKREFAERDAMSIWECCWTNYQTDYFHLFIAVAIISSYSDDVIQQDLPADEMLLHFSNLSNHMNGKIILRKARGLVHQFRLLERIPCTLQGLCSMCSPGMWDSGHVPAIECVGHHGVDGCPYLGSTILEVKAFATDVFGAGGNKS